MREFKLLIGYFLITTLVLTAHVHSAGAREDVPPPAASKYVAMGSSFAAGPGIGTSADTPPNRCRRSADNYAHQLARKRGLALHDVSCSGATTNDLLNALADLPAQLDAVDRDTKLVTVTIGGNDIGYIGGLATASCLWLHQKTAAAGENCPPVALPTEKSYVELEIKMRSVAAEVRRRAPAARLVFVDYPEVLPSRGICAATPMTSVQADESRRIARRLVAITARVANESRAKLVAASRLSRGHDACSSDAWMNGYPQPGMPVSGAPYHPQTAAMTAIAAALDKLIWR